MAFTLNKNDRELLSCIAEYRVLTVSQTAALLQRSNRSARRRLELLAAEGLVRVSTRSFGGGPGRPEGLASLAGRGIALLRKEGILASTVADDHVAAENFRTLDHQLLVNWFRIHLAQVQRVVSEVSTRFLAPTSPFLKRGPDDQPLIADRVSLGGTSERAAGFTPDGVFSVTSEDRNKTILFFLEVDMGTESLAGAKGYSCTVRQKITNYQAYFRSGGYRRYEQLWSCSLNGFRLLFLAVSPSRLGALSGLVREMPPSDFVWLTHSACMFELGVSAEIWVRGGRMDEPAQSILGTLSCPAPIPVSKP